MTSGQDKEKEAGARPEDLEPREESSDVKGGRPSRPGRPSASWE